jgi:glycosyltransferase involved in cell wall biosynthesis
VGSPLRVLHVVVNMNRGGAETLIMNLYRNLDKSRVQFDFLTFKEGIFDPEIESMGGEVFRMPYVSEVGHFNYVKNLDKFFKVNNQYSIVHSHMDKMSGLILLSAKRAGIPIRISHSHSTRSEGGLAKKLYKWYVGNFIVPNSTNLFACSNTAAQWLYKEKSKSSKILKNGIESEKFSFCPITRSQVREELNLSDDLFVIGHVGRFCHPKNHSYLVNLFAEYNKLNNKSVLILVGDGPLRSNIEKQIKRLELTGKVMFLGIRSDIHRLLQALDLFLFPSLHEGLPVSLIEAQGSGLPCIITDNISKEVDLGGNLIKFIPLKNKREWIQSINNVASKRLNRKSITNSLSKQGYDIRETAGNLEKFYLSITR